MSERFPELRRLVDETSEPKPTPSDYERAFNGFDYFEGSPRDNPFAGYTKSLAEFSVVARDQIPEVLTALDAAEAEVARLREARPRDEWHEEIGPVLWWCFPVSEPPYVGTPLDIGRTYAVEMNIADQTAAGVVTLGGWPGYHTHWTPLVVPARAALAPKEDGK